MITEPAVATPVIEIAAIDELIGRYCQVVDDQNWTQWPNLFATECSYEVQTLDNAQRDLPLAYMLDDSRDRVMDRVKFITEVWAGTIEPYRTRHVCQRTSAAAVDDSSVRVRSNFQVSYTEVDGPPTMLAAGFYDDIIEMGEASALFRSRLVYLDGMPARYLVYPL